MHRLLETWMDRYRGTSGLCGRIVLRMDVRWLKRIKVIATNEPSKDWDDYDSRGPQFRGGD